MEPTFVSRPAFTVVGMKYRGRNEQREIPQLWDRFMPRSGEIQHRVDPHVAYGVMGNYDMATGEFDYLAGFEVEGAAEIPAGMAHWDVPAQTYAVFPCTLPTLMDVIHQINQAWLPASGRQRAEGPEFEFYDERFDPSDPSSAMYIYVPLRA